MEPSKKVAGIVSIKHIYEIANYKIQDINCAHMDLKEMCIKVLNTANLAGIRVVKHDLDPKELAEFLAKRKEIEKQELEELAQKRTAKLMRAATAAAAPATTSTAIKK
jgi:large subunit ribosomal protein L11